MNRPRVGIGVFVFNTTRDKILIGKRIKEQLSGLPGGKLEYGEIFEQCAGRELCEETNIDIKDVSRIEFTCSFNCFQKEESFHWIEVYMRVGVTKEEEDTVKNLEEDKCEEWVWVSFDELMSGYSKLFYPLQQFLNRYKITSIEDIRNLKAP